MPPAEMCGISNRCDATETHSLFTIYTVAAFTSPTNEQRLRRSPSTRVSDSIPK